MDDDDYAARAGDAIRPRSGARPIGRNKRSQSHDRLRLATLEEGRAVQVMHVGPYSEEAPTIAAMHTFAESAGYKLVGKHHEIYLSDPRRTAPEKLRTVLRQPVA